MQIALKPIPTLRRIPNRHTIGLTTPMSTGIALAAERKLTTLWYYQCSRPCRDTPKPVNCRKSASTRSSTISISCTPHTSEVSTEVRSTGRSSFACSDPTMAQALIDSVGKIVGLKSQGILRSFNDIDIDQRCECNKAFCQSYLARILKTHGWDKPSPTEKSDSKPIEPLAASTTKELSTSVGPAEGSAEHRTIETEVDFSYCQVLGELTYA
jgi:hypothetical protein